MSAIRCPLCQCPQAFADNRHPIARRSQGRYDAHAQTSDPLSTGNVARTRDETDASAHHDLVVPSTSDVPVEF